MNLPFTILPTDQFFPLNAEVGACLCSRCCEPIEDYCPIMAFSTKYQVCWRYHLKCLGIESDEISYSDYEES